MRIKFFSPRWGYEHLPWKPFLKSVKDAGYAGIEWFPFGEECNHLEVLRLLKDFDLEFAIVTAVLQHYPDFGTYLSELEKQLKYLCNLTAAGIFPLFVSAQTGREYYSVEQVKKILDTCKKISQQTGVAIYQETHRNKWSFAGHSTAPLLNEYEDLYLTFDISHWFCVSESYLQDQQDTVQKAIRQSRHIHARVGHTEGPQVWDPAIPEFAEALLEHLKVWDKYVELRKLSGTSYCTITPEFGPPPYMVFGNRQGLPHEEQWRVNLWMKNFLEKRYANTEK